MYKYAVEVNKSLMFTFVYVQPKAAGRPVAHPAAPVKN